jgi:hypothetical protein
MKLKGILVRCVRKGGDRICKASEIQEATPWGMVKSTSKCREQMRGEGGVCRLAIAYDQNTKRVVETEKLRFNY